MLTMIPTPYPLSGYLTGVMPSAPNPHGNRGRSMRKMLCMAGLLGVMFASATAAEGPKRPNVVLIIADDMAWDDCGAFGNPKVRTPNIDRLAREGMRFDRAFVTASSCSPSRSSLITGRYPHNTDAEELHWPLPPEQVTFVEKLKASGYWTAAAGKWHLGNAVKDRFDLVREAEPGGLPTGGREGRQGPDDRRGLGGGPERLRPVGARPAGPAPKDKPFFLWLASLDPHRDYQPGAIPEPHRPEDVVVPPYLPDVPEVRKDLALYYDEIGRLDHYVGEVLAELDRQGVAGDTLVLFLSDNGRPFPRCKTTLYDSGIRTPLIARWPGHVEPGSRCGSLVSTIDIAPTVLRLAGIEPGPTFQGKDLSPLFKDPTAKVRDLIFAERNWHDYAAHGRAARSERFKYIRNDDHEQAADAPGRCGAEPDLPGDASAPGRREADPGAAGLLREPPARRGALRRGRRPARVGQPGRGPEVRRGAGRHEAGVVGVGAGDGGRRAREAEPRRVRPGDGRPAAEPGTSQAEEADAEGRGRHEAVICGVVGRSKPYRLWRVLDILGATPSGGIPCRN